MTNLLLDTHSFLWFLWDDAQLSKQAKALIENADNQKVVSIAGVPLLACQTVML
ncbi:MAG: hypothetical protein ABSG67_11490 [Thermoguttaceae bacterium]|jgi:PIN domain nuclease of toxin-antitoxin system